MSLPVIAIIGTGNVGAALGRRLAACGVSVRFGARDPDKIRPLAADAGPNASAHTTAEAAKGADVVFLAVPAGAALDAATGAGDLAGKILVDCTNPLRWDAGPVWNPPPEGSVAQALAKALPRARVVKGFNGFGAEFHADPVLPNDVHADVYLASDDADAKAAVSALAEAGGFCPVDAGPLRNASVVENVAILWIHLAMVGGKGRNVAFKLLDR